MSLFEDIANDLSNKINQGSYAPGTVLPSEGELQKIYQSSRTTIRNAIDLLVEKKQVIRKRGVGLFVAQRFLHKTFLK